MFDEDSAGSVEYGGTLSRLIQRRWIDGPTSFDLRNLNENRADGSDSGSSWVAVRMRRWVYARLRGGALAQRKGPGTETGMEATYPTPWPATAPPMPSRAPRGPMSAALRFPPWMAPPLARKVALG
jgi:hypothetical protein